jgi:hypothetical protein
MNTLKKLMLQAGLTNPSLAQKIGCSPVEIWRFATYPAKGGRKMNVTWAEKIAPHLNVSPQDLLFEAEPEIKTKFVQETVPIHGDIGRGIWTKLDEFEPEPSNIPKLFGAYGNYDQFAFRIKNTLTFKTPPGMSEYVVCVNYNKVRGQPLDGDLIVMNILNDDKTMSARHIYRISLQKTGFRFDQITRDHHAPDIGISQDLTELLSSNRLDISFNALVIGWLCFA